MPSSSFACWRKQEVAGGMFAVSSSVVSWVGPRRNVDRRDRIVRLERSVLAIPPMFLTGTAARASLAWINSIGSLGGFFGPWYVGVMKDRQRNRERERQLQGLGSRSENGQSLPSAVFEPMRFVSMICRERCLNGSAS